MTELTHQLEFIRGARHLVYKKKKQVVFDSGNYEMLLAIEQTLLKVNMERGYRWEVKPKQAKGDDRYELKKLICLHFGIEMSQLNGGRGKRHIVDAKRVFSYLCRKHWKDTYQRIGNELGIAHNDVMYAIEKMDDFIFTKDPVVAKMQQIEQEFFKPNL